MPIAPDRFEGQAKGYASFRPVYPEWLLARLTRTIEGARPSPVGIVVDVGSGTGIFTRQLRAILPADTQVVGIEPAADMRREAVAASSGTPGIEYRDGLAERIPIEDASARAVLAATAAHWFDRPFFYAEARRALMASGVLAIAEYVRDETSPAAAAVEQFLRGHGGPRIYGRPDYAGELRRANGFDDFTHVVEDMTLRLSPAAVVGLGLSSSHARAVIDAMGRAAAEASLLQLIEHLISEDGSIPYGYRFHLFSVRRIAEAA